jgi:hypothetical protein
MKTLSVGQASTMSPRQSGNDRHCDHWEINNLEWLRPKGVHPLSKFSQQSLKIKTVTNIFLSKPVLEVTKMKHHAYDLLQNFLPNLETFWKVSSWLPPLFQPLQLPLLPFSPLTVLLFNFPYPLLQWLYSHHAVSYL